MTHLDEAGVFQERAEKGLSDSSNPEGFWILISFISKLNQATSDQRYNVCMLYITVC